MSKSFSFPSKTWVAILVIVFGVGVIAWFINATVLPKSIKLDVPYTPQVFNGNWVSPWDEACEEASITMIDRFYAGKKEIPQEDAMANMQTMFAWETKEFGMNHDTDAEQTKRVIAEHSNFTATVKRQPSVEDIKRQIARQRPVIALLNMFTLYGERDLGDSYHVLVVIGYDDAKQEFTVHDPGRDANTRYPYDTFMNSLHDFDPKTKEASGTPTVLFTSP
jgi:uncharacterized protein YvpB